MRRGILGCAVALVVAWAPAAGTTWASDADGATALVAADLNRDGIPEIVGGFAGGTDGPFLRWAGRRLALPIRPDFLGAGDFDADGDDDVVVAERGGAGILLLSGDGRGDLVPTGFLARGRAVDVLAVADVNRADGLADLLLVTKGQVGSVLAVYESPYGASRAVAEEIPIEGQVAALAAGAFSAGAFGDVAVLAGDRLSIVRGRDRRLGMDALGRFDPGPPEIATVKLPAPGVALVAGRFGDVARGGLDLLVLDADGKLTLCPGDLGPLQAVASPPVAPPLVRAKRTSDAGDQLLARSSGAWTTLARGADWDAGAWTTRGSAAAEPTATVVLPLHGEDAGLDRIAAWLDPDLDPTLTPAAVDATFVVNTTLDTPDAAPGNGVCADATGFCSLRAAIEEANALPGTDTIVFNVGSGTPTLSLALPLPAIVETLSILGNTGGATRIQIDGSGAGGAGLRLGSQGSFTSGGSLLRALVINRFAGPGIVIETASNTVDHCLVGTDSNGGASVLGNGDGILLIGSGATGNTLGGTTGAQGNVVSGNVGAGIRIDAGAAANTVVGNLVGTNLGASAPVPNGTGVLLANGAHNNTIGGASTAPGQPPGNIVSGNLQRGIVVVGPGTTGNLVQGNLVGMAAGGTLGLGNAHGGIRIHQAASVNTIGGSAPSFRNIVSANGLGNPTAHGVEIDGASYNALKGNFVGLDITGTTPAGNGGDGISILDAAGPATGNVVGGVAASEALVDTTSTNTVSSNENSGVRVSGTGSTSNTVAGNNVGTSSSGVITIVPGNLADGIVLEKGAALNVIGGTEGVTPGGCTGACNRIAHSTGAGVVVKDVASQRNAIRGNVIASNGALGIDLGADGVTPNDPQDVDLGPNGLQNFPVIHRAFFDGVLTQIDASLDAAPATTYDVELFANLVADPSGFGEGRFFLGTTSVATDASGHADFHFAATGQQTLLSATATDPLGNTSEFGPTFANPGEARQLLQSRGPGSSVLVTFVPACGATDHAVYWGITPFAGAVNWGAVACGLGVSGTATYDPGTPPAGRAIYAVVVGQNGTVEGSYGENRPEAVFPAPCALPQERTVTCP